MPDVGGENDGVSVYLGSGAPRRTQVSKRAISMGWSFFFGGIAVSESRYRTA